MTKINADQICEVRIYDLQEDYSYEWRDAVNNWWIKYEAGFYDRYSIGEPVRKTVEEIEQSGVFVCHGDKVYRRPHISILMSDGKERNIYFKTKEEAIKHFEETPNFANINWVSI